MIARPPIPIVIPQGDVVDIASRRVKDNSPAIARLLRKPGDGGPKADVTAAAGSAAGRAPCPCRLRAAVCLTFDGHGALVAVNGHPDVVAVWPSRNEKGNTMPAMAIPLAADKLDAWEAWVAELNGPRQAAFDDMNARYGLTEHRAYLQPTPDGNFLVLVIQGGPGADSVMTNVASSDNEFDQWFMGNVAAVHGVDMSGPLPPMATRKL